MLAAYFCQIKGLLPREAISGKKSPELGCWEGLAEARIPPAHVADLFAWQENPQCS